ncbi:MerR family transcriptional regulator [Paenibacillus sp. VCA1]|uniref:MerR family transcriptional regulator n=1 Tax=Paenibacillus sp. VCA1 TaxID=3039148 RepID=UPI002872A1DD|nr:MerR family transcriptional regulator [Paenibacillus sp. VCA1]MDR9855202.1 MerR family transcriptional regulator [Paenibacillus sp. VCA1]
MAHLTIGELANQAGVHLETVRYYERRGLIPEPPRTKAGYRMYSEADVDHIRWIRQAQAIGFTLEEIRYLLMLRTGAIWPEKEMRAYARDKITEIEKKINQLVEMKSLLESAVSQTNDCLESCPVLCFINEGGESDEQKS